MGPSPTESLSSLRALMEREARAPSEQIGIERAAAIVRLGEMAIAEEPGLYKEIASLAEMANDCVRACAGVDGMDESQMSWAVIAQKFRGLARYGKEEYEALERRGLV